MSLPKEYNFSTKPNSASCTPQILRFRSQNSSYSSGDTIRIEIPTGRNGMYLYGHSSVIEGKVKLNLQGTAGNAGGTLGAQIDQSVYSMFRRVRLLHSNETLTDTLYCNRLWSAIYDLQKSISSRQGDTIHKLVSSTDKTQGVTFRTAAIAIGNRDNHVTEEIDFAFCLPNSLIGTMADKALPLSRMGASNMVLELELDSALRVFKAEATSATAAAVASINYTISEIYLNTKISILSPDVEQDLINTTGGLIIIPGIDYKGEQKVISANATTFNDKFAFNFSSVKNFLFWNGNQTTCDGAIDTNAITSRPFCRLKEYYLTLNGVQYPSQPIQNPSMMYINLLRAYDGVTCSQFSGIIGKTNYIEGTGNNDSVVGRFIGGIDLDRFNNGSHDVLITGTSTIGQNMNLVQTFSTAATVALNTYGFCMYDVLYRLEGGLLKAST